MSETASSSVLLSRNRANARIISQTQTIEKNQIDRISHLASTIDILSNESKRNDPSPPNQEEGKHTSSVAIYIFIRRMSVNEVKIKQAATALQIRGKGSPCSRTFAIGNEDHTLGNALRHVLIQNAKVDFAGYSVPHPSEPVVNIRVQAHEPTTAIQALRESCETLHSQCDIMLELLEQKLPEVAEDRIQIDAKIQKMLQEETGEDDEMEE